MTQKTYRQGQWTPGVSGNPSGRPRTPPIVKEMLGALTEKAVRALEEALDGDDPKLRLTAAQEVLNRALGRPHVTASVDVKQADASLALLAALTAKAVTPATADAPTIDATPVREALPLHDTSRALPVTFTTEADGT
jgi:hypothetical protein